MVNVSVFVALAPAASATLNVMENDPDAVGVPLSAPAALKLNPAGSIPALTDHVYGVVPPLATNVWEYATLTVLEGIAAVVMAIVGLITTEYEVVAVLLALSAALMVKLKVPDAVGVPLKTPAELKLNPAGSVPALTDHVYGVVPPLAASVCEYVAPTVEFGSDAVVIERLEVVPTVSVSDWVIE
jgi:hypothetical protein